MLAEIGLVGKAPGRYNLHLGGNKAGTRVPKMYKENISVEQILTDIDNLVARWSQSRADGEAFGDFVVRVGVVDEVLISVRDFYA